MRPNTGALLAVALALLVSGEGITDVQDVTGLQDPTAGFAELSSSTSGGDHMDVTLLELSETAMAMDPASAAESALLLAQQTKAADDAKAAKTAEASKLADIKAKEREEAAARKAKQAAAAKIAEGLAEKAKVLAEAQRKKKEAKARLASHGLTKAKMTLTQAAAKREELKAAYSAMKMKVERLSAEIFKDKMLLSNATDARRGFNEQSTQSRESLNHAAANAASASANAKVKRKAAGKARSAALKARNAAGLAKEASGEAKARMSRAERSKLNAQSASRDAGDAAGNTASIAASSKGAATDALTGEQQLEKDKAMTIALGKRLVGLTHASEADKKKAESAAAMAHTAHTEAADLKAAAIAATSARKRKEAASLAAQVKAEKGAGDFSKIEDYVAHLADRAKTLEAKGAEAQKADTAAQAKVNALTEMRMTLEKRVETASRAAIPVGTPIEKVATMLEAKKKSSHEAITNLHAALDKQHAAYEVLKGTRAKVARTVPLAKVIRQRLDAALVKSKALQISKASEAADAAVAGKQSLAADKLAAELSRKADAAQAVAMKDDEIAARAAQIEGSEEAKAAAMRAQEDAKAREVMKELDDLAANSGARDVTLLTWTMETDSQKDAANLKARVAKKAGLVASLFSAEKKLLTLQTQQAVYTKNSKTPFAQVQAVQGALADAQVLVESYKAELALMQSRATARDTHKELVFSAQNALLMHSASRKAYQTAVSKVRTLKLSRTRLLTAVTAAKNKVKGATNAEEKEVASITLKQVLKQQATTTVALRYARQQRTTMRQATVKARAKALHVATLTAERKLTVLEHRVTKATTALKAARKSANGVLAAQAALNKAAGAVDLASKSLEKREETEAAVGLKQALIVAAAAGRALIKAKGTKGAAFIAASESQASAERTMIEARFKVSDAALHAKVGDAKRALRGLRAKAGEAQGRVVQAQAVRKAAKGTVARKVSYQALAQSRKDRNAAEAGEDKAYAVYVTATRKFNQRRLDAQRGRFLALTGSRDKSKALVAQALATAKNANAMGAGNVTMAKVNAQVMGVRDDAAAAENVYQRAKAALAALEQDQRAHRASENAEEAKEKQERAGRNEQEAQGGIISAVASLMRSKTLKDFQAHLLDVQASRKIDAEMSASNTAQGKSASAADDRSIEKMMRAARGALADARDPAAVTTATQGIAAARGQREASLRARLVAVQQSALGALQSGTARVRRAMRYMPPAEAAMKTAKDATAKALAGAILKEAKINLADANFDVQSANNAMNAGKQALEAFDKAAIGRADAAKKKDARVKLAAARAAGAKGAVAAEVAERELQAVEFRGKHREMMDKQAKLWSVVVASLAQIKGKTKPTVQIMAALSPALKRQRQQMGEIIKALRLRVAVAPKGSAPAMLISTRAIQSEHTATVAAGLPVGPDKTAALALSKKLNKAKEAREEAAVANAPAGPAQQSAELALLAKKEKALGLQKAKLASMPEGPAKMKRMVALGQAAETLLAQAKYIADSLPAASPLKAVMMAKVAKKEALLIAAQKAEVAKMPAGPAKMTIVARMAATALLNAPAGPSKAEAALLVSAPNPAATAAKEAAKISAAGGAATKAKAKADADVTRCQLELKNALPAGKAMAMKALTAAKAKAAGAKAEAIRLAAQMKQQALEADVVASSQVAKKPEQLKASGTVLPAADDPKVLSMKPAARRAYLAKLFGDYQQTTNIGKNAHAARTIAQLITVSTKLSTMSASDRKKTLLKKTVTSEQRRSYVKQMIAAKSAAVVNRASAAAMVANHARVASRAQAKAAGQQLADAKAKSDESRNKKRELAMYAQGWESW